MSARRLLVPVLCGLACSYAEPDPAAVQCAEGDACEENFSCVNNRCLPSNQVAPRRALAFEISEPDGAQVAFRTELYGCDFEVGIGDNGRELVVTREDNTQTLELAVLLPPEEGAVDGGEGDTDGQTPDPALMLPAQMDLTQDGRLGHGDLRRPQIDNLDDGMPPAPTVVPVPWARYDLRDANLPTSYLLWETRPTDRAPLIQAFRPPLLDDLKPCDEDVDCGESGRNYCATEYGLCTATGDPVFYFEMEYEPLCDRQVTGTVSSYDIDAGTVGAALEGANVRLRHKDVEGLPPLFSRLQAPGVDDGEFDCSADDPCDDPALVCNVDAGTCALRMDDRQADGGSGSNTDVAGEFSTRVYMYCEDLPTAGGTRGFTVTVAAGQGRPTVSYAVDAPLSAPEGGQAAPVNIGSDLCVPDWGAPVTVFVDIDGPSSVLVPGDEAYRCCDVGCLPARDDLVDPDREPDDRCNGGTQGATPSVRLETTLELDEAERQRWIEASCAEPVRLPDSDVVGRLTRDADCSVDPCQATGLAPGDGTTPRVYAMRVETPVGSLLASRDLAVEVGPTQTELPTVELASRTLVRGHVTVAPTVCSRRDDPNDCESLGAVVMAERLAMDGESAATVPGPYFHQVGTYYDPSTGRDGAFVLPLDAGGVYVLTALPAPGEDGGPAGFVLVDLRDSEPDEIELQLLEGILVTVNLLTFDRRAQVVPIDLAGFEELLHPGRVEAGETDPFVDLGRVGECLRPAADVELACRIRELVVPGTNVRLSQVSRAEFSARAVNDGDNCPAP